MESLENILKNGYGTWRKNLILSLPFLFSSIISLIVIGVFIFGALLAVGGLFATAAVSLGSSLADPSSLIGANLLPLIFLIVAVAVLFIVIVSLIDAFFQAGAIGMAKEATQKGKTSLESMINYGKRTFISLFFANLLVGIIIVLGLAIILGVFIGIPFLLGAFSGYGGLNLGLLLFVVLGAILAIIYLLATTIIFAPVQYALVVSDLGATDGVKKGYQFFKENKLYVFLMWLVLLAIGVGIAIVSTIIRLPFSFIPLLGALVSAVTSILTALFSVLILAPLTAVWWTRLYMDRTKIPQRTPATPKKSDISI